MRLTRGKRVIFALMVVAPGVLGLLHVVGERRWRAGDAGYRRLQPSYGLVTRTKPESLPPWRASGPGCRWLAGTYAPDEVPRFCLVQRFDDRALQIHDGIWGPALPRLRPPGEHWVGCFGGSTVEGYPSTDAHVSWPAKLEERLANAAGRGPIRVVNFGFAGASSAPELARLVHEALPRGVDVVLLYTAINDTFSCHYFEPRTEEALAELMFRGDATVLDGLDPWFRQHRDDWLSIYERLWTELREQAKRMGIDAGRLREPETYSAVRQQLLDRKSSGKHGLHAQFAHPVSEAQVEASLFVSLPPPVVLAGPLGRNVRRMIETARASGARVILVHDPWGHRCVPVSDFACTNYPLDAADLTAYVVHAVAGAWAELAREYHVPLVDLHEPLNSGPDSCGNFVDVMHLSEVGLDRVAELLAPVVLGEVRAAGG